MAYTRNPTWQDSPSVATPITAATLNNIENGIVGAASGYRKVQRPPTFVSFGDSTSVTPGAGQTYPELLSAVSNQRLRLIYNAGVPGNTTTQMLARIQTDVIAKAPAYCIVLGGTNDIGGAVALATIGANLNAIYDALVAAGIQPIAASITPRNTNTDVARVRDLNNWIKGNAIIRGIPCIDINAALVDPATGWYLTTLNADAVHPNGLGAIAMAQAALTVMTSAIGVANPLPPSLLPLEYNDAAWAAGPVASTTSTQIILNPLMAGATITPDRWSLSATDPGITQSLVTDSRFRGQALKWVATAAAASQTVRQQISAGSGIFAVGDKLRLNFRYAIDSSTGVPSGNGLQVNIYALGPNTQTNVITQWGTPINNAVATYDYTVPASTTGLLIQIVGVFGGGNATTYVGEMALTNLTTLGLTALP